MTWWIDSRWEHNRGRAWRTCNCGSRHSCWPTGSGDPSWERNGHRCCNGALCPASPAHNGCSNAPTQTLFCKYSDTLKQLPTYKVPAIITWKTLLCYLTENPIKTIKKPNTNSYITSYFLEHRSIKLIKNVDVYYRVTIGRSLAKLSKNVLWASSDSALSNFSKSSGGNLYWKFHKISIDSQLNKQNDCK